MTILDIETTRYKLRQLEAQHADTLKKLGDMDIIHRKLEDDLFILEGRITELREITKHNPPAETFEQVRAKEAK